ncbi:MAG: alpha/beta hydrolase [Oligoflexia bacterium]|nr:alpha/beta hydrolase [Oligoflexia bacterium]
MKTVILSFLLSLSFFLQANEVTQGFIKLSNEESLFVEYYQGDTNKEVYVMVNGLVYSTKRWRKVAKSLHAAGHSVLTYEFTGQNNSYVSSMEENDGKPEWLYDGLTLKKMAANLNEITKALKLKRFNLVGLSFGSSIASTYAMEYSEDIKNLVLMSPLVISLDRYDSQGRYFRLWLSGLELWGPVGQFWANYYYDQVYLWYYRNRPPRDHGFGVWEKDYYRAVFHQVKAVKDFDLRKLKFEKVFKDQKIHLLTASKEEPKYLEDQLKMKELWKKEIQGKHLHIKGAHHAIPDTAPKAATRYLLGL